MSPAGRGSRGRGSRGRARRGWRPQPRSSPAAPHSSGKNGGSKALWSLMQTTRVVRGNAWEARGHASSPCKRPVVSVERAGHSAEKGHFQSGWTHSPIIIRGPVWEASPSPSCFPAHGLCVCVRGQSFQEFQLDECGIILTSHRAWQ